MPLNLFNEKEHTAKTITCITKFFSHRCAIRIRSLIFCNTYNAKSQILVEADSTRRPNEQKHSELV